MATHRAQPPPGTVPQRNSVKILTNLCTHQGQPRERGGEGREGKGRERDKLVHKCMIWSSKLHNLPERVCVI